MHTKHIVQVNTREIFSAVDASSNGTHVYTGYEHVEVCWWHAEGISRFRVGWSPRLGEGGYSTKIKPVSFDFDIFNVTIAVFCQEFRIQFQFLPASYLG